jgi:DNA repair exonuclease SbcCD ATPase subunit
MNDFSEKIKDLQARLNLYKEAMTKLAQQINELTAHSNLHDSAQQLKDWETKLATLQTEKENLHQELDAKITQLEDGNSLTPKEQSQLIKLLVKHREDFRAFNDGAIALLTSYENSRQQIINLLEQKNVNLEFENRIYRGSALIILLIFLGLSRFRKTPKEKKELL